MIGMIEMIDGMSAEGIRDFAKSLRDNERIVMGMVSHNGLLLEFASDRLKDKEEIVIAAINNDKSALKFASPRLKEDKYILSIINK